MRLIILGAGGYGQTVKDLAQQMNLYSEILFLDDGNNQYLDCSHYLDYRYDHIYPAFGDNQIRLEWIHRLMKNNIIVPTLVHPLAYVSPTVQLGQGCMVLPMSVINTNTVIEDGCIINCGAIVDHDCWIEKGSHICLHATIKANNRIESCTKIEAGIVVENGNWK